ncbi:C45 family autoproteolytic acyltransferase/hydolase [uncultured Weeksella sp.]|uniref:C45 family autoproteolytic acyltransferase/hydolase n=1 Tax=uncultured Weeksella sp. TaxID=1161389 RepID=UPI00259B895C|nr:C45 family autoproteolytic acyltransferase/hydolase [uncultured Weeksella sp.]
MKNFLALIMMILLLQSCGINRSLKQTVNVSSYPKADFDLVKINDTVRKIGQNFLRKNIQGNWELYLSGNPYAIGVKNGMLTQKLYQHQEEVFFNGVQQLVGENKKVNFALIFLKWFNRDIQEYILPEYQAELYGLSQFASDQYAALAPSYQRNLYLHGAHDIGHAMTDLMIVGCSSVALWDEKSIDQELIIGRNFDFYINDEFAENKLVQFILPEKGYGFLSVSWPGFIGVTSGMNTEGLTATINAGKSSIPHKAKTPISLVVREILQYASTIEEAISIAKKKEVFVSESIMIGSAKDRKAVLIEISPKKFDVVYPQQSYLISTNHFQGQVYQTDKRNQQHIINSHSDYRYQKIKEKIDYVQVFDVEKVIRMLQDYKGLSDKEIGYGNEKALNALLAHHGIVFRPEKKLVYVSSSPYNLGEYTVYDLNFLNDRLNLQTAIVIDSLKIKKSPFVDSHALRDFEKFKKLRREIRKAHQQKIVFSDDKMTEYISLNPSFWEVYNDAAINALLQKKYDLAIHYFREALKKEITTIPDRKKIEKQLVKLRKYTK